MTLAVECDCWIKEDRVWTDSLQMPYFDVNLLAKDFIVPRFTVPPTRMAQAFGPDPENTVVEGSKLLLKVQAGTTRGAEIQTWRRDILFGSFSAQVTYPTIGGTCSGFFAIMPGSNSSLELERGELDIEYLPSKPNVFHYVIHPRDFLADGSASEQSFRTFTFQGSPSPKRLIKMDWSRGQADFFVDNQWTVTMQTKIDAPATFTINHWSNGDENWTGGPPLQTSAFALDWLSFFFNTTTPKTCSNICQAPLIPTEYVSTCKTSSAVKLSILLFLVFFL